MNCKNFLSGLLKYLPFRFSVLDEGNKTAREIAKILGIGKAQIGTHRKNIMKKLELNITSSLWFCLCFLEE